MEINVATFFFQVQKVVEGSTLFPKNMRLGQIGSFLPGMGEKIQVFEATMFDGFR